MSDLHQWRTKRIISKEVRRIMSIETSQKIYSEKLLNWSFQKHPPLKPHFNGNGMNCTKYISMRDYSINMKPKLHVCKRQWTTLNYVVMQRLGLHLTGSYFIHGWKCDVKVTGSSLPSLLGLPILSYFCVCCLYPGIGISLDTFKDPRNSTWIRRFPVLLYYSC